VKAKNSRGDSDEMQTVKSEFLPEDAFNGSIFAVLEQTDYCLKGLLSFEVCILFQNL